MLDIRGRLHIVLIVSSLPLSVVVFFSTETILTDAYTLSLHDALPIYPWARWGSPSTTRLRSIRCRRRCNCSPRPRDRKSTRLNSSHLGISYAVFCLKKKSRHPGVDLTLTG